MAERAFSFRPGLPWDVAMPMKPEKQNPFWPAPPQARRGTLRVIAMVVVLLFALVAARFLARIFWG